MSTNPEHINQLAAIIREVQGTRRMGAAALAEAILSHPGSLWQPPAALIQPTMTDFRVLYVSLIDHLQVRVSQEDREIPMHGYYSQSQQLLDRARAALAQPEELLRVYCNARRAYCHDGPEHIDWQRDAERGATLAGLGAVLTRWGRPPAPPAPEVGES
jgi:hypothetical protein